METSATVIDQVRAASAAWAGVSSEVADFRCLDDVALLELTRMHAAAQRAVGATGALIAGEIARRSAPEFGSSGLAQRTGHRTPINLIKATTGSTATEAGTAVRVGVLVHDAADNGTLDVSTGEIAAAARPWLAPVAEAVRAGILSFAAAESIGRGLGEPSAAITAQQLEVAAAALCTEAFAGLDADRLFHRARQFRDEIDVEGVKDREDERRRRRSLTFVRQPDGMTKLVWLMDPETAATVKEVYDRAVSPKLGGVRFVDKLQKAKAVAIFEDPRTTEQLASDTFEHLIKQGADAPTDRLLGSGAPVIRIAASKTAVESKTGLAHIEGQPDAVSIDTLERLACEGQMTVTTYDSNLIPLDFGREKRLFTKAQKDVLALTWGGCMADCNRPPSWCEAHHINGFARDNGKTDIADGILLCKHHHRLFHNNGWEITRDADNKYWVIPPPDVDPKQVPRLLETKSRAVQDLRREAG
jgi:hypothetical protein